MFCAVVSNILAVVVLLVEILQTDTCTSQTVWCSIVQSEHSRKQLHFATVTTHCALYTILLCCFTDLKSPFLFCAFTIIGHCHMFMLFCNVQHVIVIPQTAMCN